MGKQFDRHISLALLVLLLRGYGGELVPTHADQAKYQAQFPSVRGHLI